jgi:hypothetical protein
MSGAFCRLPHPAAIKAMQKNRAKHLRIPAMGVSYQAFDCIFILAQAKARYNKKTRNPASFKAAGLGFPFRGGRDISWYREEPIGVPGGKRNQSLFLSKKQTPRRPGPVWVPTTLPTEEKVHRLIGYFS